MLSAQFLLLNNRSLISLSMQSYGRQSEQPLDRNSEGEQ